MGGWRMGGWRMGGWEDGRMGGWEDRRRGGWEDGDLRYPEKGAGFLRLRIVVWLAAISLGQQAGGRWDA